MINIPLQDFVILALLIVLLILAMSVFTPNAYEAFRVFIISASIGWFIGRLLLPVFLPEMDPTLIDYLSFAVAGGVTLMSRAYFTKKTKHQVRYT